VARHASSPLPERPALRQRSSIALSTCVARRHPCSPPAPDRAASSGNACAGLRCAARTGASPDLCSSSAGSVPRAVAEFDPAPHKSSPSLAPALPSQLATPRPPRARRNEGARRLASLPTAPLRKRVRWPPRSPSPTTPDFSPIDSRTGAPRTSPLHCATVALRTRRSAATTLHSASLAAVAPDRAKSTHPDPPPGARSAASFGNAALACAAPPNWHRPRNQCEQWRQCPASGSRVLPASPKIGCFARSCTAATTRNRAAPACPSNQRAPPLVHFARGPLAGETGARNVLAAVTRSALSAALRKPGPTTRPC